MVAKLSIPFCTQVKRANSGFVNSIEGYLNFGGKVAYVVDVGKGSLSVLIKENKQSFLKVTAKILTMVLSLGLLPLATLTIKILSRASLKGRVDAISYTDSTQKKKKLLKSLQSMLPGLTASFNNPKTEKEINRISHQHFDPIIKINQRCAKEMEKCRNPTFSESEGDMAGTLRTCISDLKNQNEPCANYYLINLKIIALRESIKSPFLQLTLSQMDLGL